MAGILLLDLAAQGVHISNLHAIYVIRPEARNRLTAGYMTCYFIGGAACSLLSAWAYSRRGWAGVSLAGAAVSAAGLLLGGPRPGVHGLHGHARPTGRQPSLPGSPVAAQAQQAEHRRPGGPGGLQVGLELRHPVVVPVRVHQHLLDPPDLPVRVRDHVGVAQVAPFGIQAEAAVVGAVGLQEGLEPVRGPGRAVSSWGSARRLAAAASSKSRTSRLCRKVKIRSRMAAVKAWRRG